MICENESHPSLQQVKKLATPLSVNFFCRGFSCFPYYRGVGVRYSGVSARQELTVLSKYKKEARMDKLEEDCKGLQYVLLWYFKTC